MSTTSPNMAALTTPDRLASPTPGGRWLSNGNYSVLVTRAGTGWSRASGYALTRWTADRIEDRTGFFVFVRDTATGSFFSVTEEPAGAAAESRVFSSAPGRVRFVRQGQGLESRLDVCVLADRDAELRRLTITNSSHSPPDAPPDAALRPPIMAATRPCSSTTRKIGRASCRERV